MYVDLEAVDARGGTVPTDQDLRIRCIAERLQLSKHRPRHGLRVGILATEQSKWTAVAVLIEQLNIVAKMRATGRHDIVGDDDGARSIGGIKRRRALRDERGRAVLRAPVKAILARARGELEGNENRGHRAAAAHARQVLAATTVIRQIDGTAAKGWQWANQARGIRNPKDIVCVRPGDRDICPDRIGENLNQARLARNGTRRKFHTDGAFGIRGDGGGGIAARRAAVKGRQQRIVRLQGGQQQFAGVKEDFRFQIRREDDLRRKIIGRRLRGVVVVITHSTSDQVGSGVDGHRNFQADRVAVRRKFNWPQGRGGRAISEQDPGNAMVAALAGEAKIHRLAVRGGRHGQPIQILKHHDGRTATAINLAGRRFGPFALAQDAPSRRALRRQQRAARRLAYRAHGEPVIADTGIRRQIPAAVHK